MCYVCGMAKVKRRKPAEVRKMDNLNIRLAASHKAEIAAAAERTGISISAWAVERLLKAARQESGSQGAA